MRMPKERIRFTSSVDGKTAPGGFLVLDLKGLDIEGVNALVIPMEDVDTAKSRGGAESDALRRARDLLGGL